MFDFFFEQKFPCPPGRDRRQVSTTDGPRGTWLCCACPSCASSRCQLSHSTKTLEPQSELSAPAAQRPPTVWPLCSSRGVRPMISTLRLVKTSASPVLKMGRRPKPIFDGPSHFTKLQHRELKTSPCNGYVTVIYNLHMILLPFLGAEPVRA